jgi:hypothetical protein
MIQFAHRLLAESMAAAREEAHAFAVAAHEQPVSVMLDFMDPLRAGRRLVGENRNARLNEPGGRDATLDHHG